MIKQYQEELKALKEKMAGAEKFAEKIPLFHQFILDNKLDGTEDCVMFASRYKQIYFDWGLHRARFKSGTGRPIYTHEIPAVLDEYHSKIRQDFVMLEVEEC